MDILHFDIRRADPLNLFRFFGYRMFEAEFVGLQAEVLFHVGTRRMGPQGERIASVVCGMSQPVGVVPRAIERNLLFGGAVSPPEDLSIGIVVLVLNEGKTLSYFLSRLYEVSRARYPVVVVDGGSTDDSVRIARQFFHTETMSVPNRGKQLNHGARALVTDVLLFLHADSELPRGFDFHIRRVLANPEVLGGCFRLEFDASHPLLRFYSWFTQFPGRFFHYGDQGFFIRRDAFCEIGGFSPLPFLEDVEFLHRLRRQGKFVVLPTSVRTSARRFLKRGVVRQQLTNILLVALFELGLPAGTLAKFYQQVR